MCVFVLILFTSSYLEDYTEHDKDLDNTFIASQEAVPDTKELMISLYTDKDAHQQELNTRMLVNDALLYDNTQTDEDFKDNLKEELRAELKEELKNEILEELRQENIINESTDNNFELFMMASEENIPDDTSIDSSIMLLSEPLKEKLSDEDFLIVYDLIVNKINTKNLNYNTIIFFNQELFNEVNDFASLNVLGKEIKVSDSEANYDIEVLFDDCSMYIVINRKVLSNNEILINLDYYTDKDIESIKNLDIKVIKDNEKWSIL